MLAWLAGMLLETRRGGSGCVNVGAYPMAFGCFARKTTKMLSAEMIARAVVCSWLAL